MAKILQAYKADIIQGMAPHKIKFKHQSSDFIERLTFDVRLPDEVTSIHFEFSLVLKNHFVSLAYAFIKAPKKKTPKRIDYTLANLTKETILVGISQAALVKLLEVQKFKVDEGKIMTLSTIEDQMEVYVTMIKNNLSSLIEAATLFVETGN